MLVTVEEYLVLNLSLSTLEVTFRLKISDTFLIEIEMETFFFSEH